MHAMIFVEQTEVNKAFLVLLGHIIWCSHLNQNDN